MKVAALILTMFLAAVSAAGQVLTVKNDIPESQYLAAERKAADLLKTANCRSVWVLDVVSVSNPQEVFVNETVTREWIRPDKMRFLREVFGEHPLRFEQRWVGGEDFVKANGEPWMKNPSTHSTILSRGFGETFDRRYRYLPSVQLEDMSTDLYESTYKTFEYVDLKSVKVPFYTTIQIWYSKSGNILKRLEESVGDGYKMKRRETITYQYDPKDLKIEAPVIGEAPAKQ